MTTKIEKIIINTLKFIGLLLLTVIWSSIPMIICELLNININELNTTLKIIISLINDIIIILIFLFIYRKTIKKDFKNYFNKNLKNNLKQSLKVWAIGFSIMIISNLLIAIITKGKIAQNEESVRVLIDKYPLYMLFQLMIYAPIIEELIFRKSIKDITNKKYLYIFLSGFIFGGLHIIASIKNPIELLFLVPYCSQGFAFAYLYHKTDNIFSTITAHSFHNTLTLLLYLKGIH